MAQIRPYLHPLVKDLLADCEFCFQAFELTAGPTNLLLPQVFAENVRELQQIGEDFGVDLQVHFAQKANSSKVFTRQALLENISIDAASVGELAQALGVGFSGDKIECTGPKNRTFLELAMRQGCLISLDSPDELQSIVEIRQEFHLQGQVRLLIRLNNPPIAGRQMQAKNSRFGVEFEQVSEYYPLLKQYDFLNFKGFHFHAYGYDDETRGMILSSLISLTEQAHAEGFQPDLINIGGASRSKSLSNQSDWTDYLGKVEETLLEGKEVDWWGNGDHCLMLNSKGKIEGREKSLIHFPSGNYADSLKNILSYAAEYRSNAQRLAENEFSLMVEPGYGLLRNAGISLMEVMSLKQSGKHHLIVADCNMYNLALARIFDNIADPVLLQRKPKLSQVSSKYSALIAGNLCMEGDMILKREVDFDQEPCHGDLLAFVNTAAYHGSFENSAPIMQPPAQNLVVLKEESWQLMGESNY